MGLFDGLDGDSEAGSTAEVAKRLGLPVLLVVDASAQVRSAAAVVLGAEALRPRGSLGRGDPEPGRRRAPRQLAPRRPRAGVRDPVFGALAWADGIRLPERHLGLVTAMEGRFSLDLFERLADVAESSVDLDACLALATSTVEPSVPPTRVAPRCGSAWPRTRPSSSTTRTASTPSPAQERRSCRGALSETRGHPTWTPLPGRRLSRGPCRAPGANRTAREAVRAFARDGRPVYAECGGLMYLAEALEDLKGAFHAMAGRAARAGADGAPRLTIGYREVRLAGDGPFGPAGRCSAATSSIAPTWEPLAGPRVRARGGVSMTDPTTGETWTEGFRQGRTLASYAHLHLGSCPGAARGVRGRLPRARAGRAP